MTHDEIRELIPAYSLNAVGVLEKVQVEQHLETCDQCHRLLMEHLEAAGLMAFTSEPVIPSRDLRDRLMVRVGERGDGREATTATVPLRRRRVAFGALAGAVAVVVALLVFVLPRGRAPETLTPEIVAILGSQSLANAPMQPTREIPNASGQIFYGGQTDSVAVIVRGLRDPGGLNYMLWLVVDGRAAPLGEFEVDEDGSSVILVKSVPDDLDGWLVTLEDSAETRVPEGRIILTSEETTLP